MTQSLNAVSLVSKVAAADPADALDGADVVGVLRPQVPGVRCLDFAVRFLLLLGLLHRPNLLLGQDHPGVLR